MTQTSTKLMIFAISFCLLHISPTHASEWLCAAIGAKTITILKNKVVAGDMETATPPAKLSDLSKIGGRLSNKYGTFDFENLSYYETDEFLEFMGQKIKRRNDGSISIMEYYDFTGNKSEKTGQLVLRIQHGGASLTYDLIAYQCDALG